MDKKIKEKEKVDNFQTQYKKYKIEINKDMNNSKIIINIANNNKITHKKSFSFEDIEKCDFEFFVPFNNNLLILYKFLIRFLRAKMFELTEKNEYISLVLYCLKNNELKSIIIDIPSIPLENGIKNNNKDRYFEEISEENLAINNNNESEEDNKNINEEYNIGSAPAPNLKKRRNKYKSELSVYEHSNKKYNIELKKIENLYNNTKEYREIEIKINKVTKRFNNNESIIYYDYLDSQDIFDASIPYYNLFDCSIDDVYDDLNIIFYHKNYRVETGKDCIKLFFQVFNIGEGSKDPYTEIFIQALNRERTNDELIYKMKRVFSEPKNNIIIEKNKLDQSNGINDNKNINNNDENKSDIPNDKKNEIKFLNSKINKDNYSENFLKSFLQLKNNDLKNRKNETLINGSIQKDNTKTIKQEIKKNNNDFIGNSFYINNNLNNHKFQFVCYNNKQNNQNYFNKNENSNEKNNIKFNYINQKRYNDTKLEMYYNKKEKNNGNEKENENYYGVGYGGSIKENLFKDNLLNINEIDKENKNKQDKNKKIEKNCDKKDFILDENKRYNINEKEVINNYQNLSYVHPLDNDEDLEIITNKEKGFFLCKICKSFFESKYKVRKHQWVEHLKPYGYMIQKHLFKQKFSDMEK